MICLRGATSYRCRELILSSRRQTDYDRSSRLLLHHPPLLHPPPLLHLMIMSPACNVDPAQEYPLERGLCVTI